MIMMNIDRVRKGHGLNVDKRYGSSGTIVLREKRKESLIRRLSVMWYGTIKEVKQG